MMKGREKKSQSNTNNDIQSQRATRSDSQFVDNRPEVIVQRRIQEIANKTGSMQFKNVIQGAFTAKGIAAKARVAAITGENPNFDSFDKNTFGDWHPNGARIGFDPAIRQYIIDNAPHDAPKPGETEGWIKCGYCNYEYPLNRIQVDHVVNWADYSLEMTTEDDIRNARAWEVYIGCNDPNNLVASCDSCNASKGDKTATAAWVNKRRDEAAAIGGF